MPAKGSLFYFWKSCRWRLEVERIYFRQILEGLAVGWIHLLLRNDKIAEGPPFNHSQFNCTTTSGIVCRRSVTFKCIITTRSMLLHVKQTHRNKLDGWQKSYSTICCCFFKLVIMWSLSNVYSWSIKEKKLHYLPCLDLTFTALRVLKHSYT